MDGPEWPLPTLLATACGPNMQQLPGKFDPAAAQDQTSRRIPRSNPRRQSHGQSPVIPLRQSPVPGAASTETAYLHAHFPLHLMGTVAKSPRPTDD